MQIDGKLASMAITVREAGLVFAELKQRIAIVRSDVVPCAIKLGCRKMQADNKSMVSARLHDG